MTPCNGIDARSACTLVACHPLPSNHKRRLVTDQVEHVAEPAIRFGPRPSMQLALMVEYPHPCRCRLGPRCAAIQQRPPRHLMRLLPRCRPSPCDRLSRPPSTTAAPPRPDTNSGRRTCPPPCGMQDGEGDIGSLPTFTDVRFDGVGAQLYPDGVAHPSDRNLGVGLRSPIGYGQPERRGHRLRLPPVPRRDPSTRFDRSLTTHGASTTDSVSLHLPVTC